jgi:collagen type IV alpha-3-binding protein
MNEIQIKWNIKLILFKGEMKIYRRELEENGLVLDPLKAVHTVKVITIKTKIDHWIKYHIWIKKGITGHELCKYFWDPAVRMEWEGTLDSSRMIEALSDDTLIFHQVHKRVWPSAQRDTCFWSHIRSVDKNEENKNPNSFPDWIVVNYSTTHDLAPVNIFKVFPIFKISNIPLVILNLVLNNINIRFYKLLLRN